MPRPAFRWLARLGALAAVLLSLLPLVQLGAMWVEYESVIGLPLQETPPRGFDGVRWADRDGVVAEYVFPRSPGAEAGVLPGDRLLSIDTLPVDSAAVAEVQVDRATGTVLSYALDREGTPVEVAVRITRFPTLLYPLSATLWTAATWGFALVVYLHLLAYLTVAPLARRSARAQRSRLLIAAALAWVGGTLVRLVWVRVWGVPEAGGVGGVAFDAITLASLAGWIVYPALLLDQSLRAWRAGVALGAARWAFVVPPALLGAGIIGATVGGHLGPLPPDAFVVPVLFYVCVYVALATGLSALRPRPEAAPEVSPAPRWSVVGSAFVAVVAAAGAVYVATQIQTAPRADDVVTGWVVTGFQLFSLLPVALVTLSTLRYGQFDALFVRGMATLATLTVVFAAVVLGSLLLDAWLPGGANAIALGVLIAALLGGVERLAPALRDAAQRAFRTERQRGRRRLDRLGDSIRGLLDVDALASEAVEAIGEALDARSAVVVLLASKGTADERWVKATYRPEAPRFEQADLDEVWPLVRDEATVWSRNEEVNEAELPPAVVRRLEALQVALTVPVTTGAGEPVGVILLGRRARRFAVYNTEDIDRLRALAAQLALAVDRLALLDRERALVRQTAEAELVALRAQINPHFLFNALNTVAALIAERPEEAEETVELLAGLFRDVLNASGHALVPLRDELRLVERYLGVEQARFGDALDIVVDAPPETLDHDIPAFAVQTLVENAVKHGIERKRGGGRVSVRARLREGALVVTVDDTGAGLPASEPSAHGCDPAFFGVGLSNVSERIRQLYPGRGGVTVEPLDEGTRATLTLPLTRPVLA
ncbi:MAG: histidine kinase [Bacteroidota bacterium]